MSRSHRPRRTYDSPEAGKAALWRTFHAIWNQHVEVANSPPTLYQYRDEDVFQKILKSGNLWVSDVPYPFADIISPLVAERENGESKYFLKAVAPAELVRKVFGTFWFGGSHYESTTWLASASARVLKHPSQA
jgi:hypothetical protein